MSGRGRAQSERGAKVGRVAGWWLIGAALPLLGRGGCVVLQAWCRGRRVLKLVICASSLRPPTPLPASFQCVRSVAGVSMRLSAGRGGGRVRGRGLMRRHYRGKSGATRANHAQV